jgi:D-aspartate ligase
MSVPLVAAEGKIPVPGQAPRSARHLPGDADSPEEERNQWSTQRCGALVLGGAHGALAAIRSLGRQRIPVWFLTDQNSIARFSRYTGATLIWPGPRDSASVDFLLELGRRCGLNGWLLLSCGDEEARLVSQNRRSLSSIYRVTTPPWETMRFAYDKRLTYERAAALGIDHPHSHYPVSRQDLARLDICYPAILKPAVKNEDNPFTLAKAWRVDNRRELLARYDEAAGFVPKDVIVIQELIPGRGTTQYSYAAVWDHGRPVASLVAQRLRQYPIDFGYSSTFVKTVVQNEIESAACCFLESIAYDGLVEVEFKFDARDGRYKLLDVNPRTWTWLSLGCTAGVDFPHILWRIATGETVPLSRGQSGAAWSYLSRDIVALCQEAKRSGLSRTGYGDAIGKMNFAAFAKDDPWPALMDIPIVLHRVLTRRVPAIARRMVRNPANPIAHEKL